MTVVRVQIESGIRLRLGELPRHVVDLLIQQATHTDPMYKLHRRRGLPLDGLTPRIETYRLGDRTLHLWRGCLGRVIRTLRQEGLEHELIDNRLWLPRVKMQSSIKLREYQREACRTMIRRQQTVGRGPAGSGKTEMLLYVAARFAQPTLVLVWQERQQRVWLERIARYFDFEPGGVGGAFAQPLVAPITVGMVQSVRNRLDDLRYRFGCVICDEVSRFAAPTLREVVNVMPAAVRLGASDDERRRDGREFLLYDTFGPRGWRLDVDAGQCDVEIRCVKTGFRSVRDEVSAYEWAAVVNELVGDEDRNELILDLACMEVRGGHRVLIWSDRVGHCRELKAALIARGYRAGLLIGGNTQRTEADATEKGLNEGTIEIGIGTTVAEQSINIPPLDRGIMTCASAGAKMYRFRQMRGRLARPFPGKTSAVLWYLWDVHVPMLKRKIYNIKRLYRVSVVQPGGKHGNRRQSCRDA